MKKHSNRSTACRVEYDPQTCFSLLHSLYHDADPFYLRKYVDFCFSSNQYKAGFVAHKPSHQSPNVRYHHLFPKCLVPSMASSITNLVQISKQDHFDAHCLLVFAFRDYYHSTDRNKSRIFHCLSIAVGATLGQLPQRIQSANRDWYANEFYKLTSKNIGNDILSVWKDYQAMRRSTPDGKAYDRLKSYLRFLTKKYDITYPSGLGVAERAKSLVSASILPISEKDMCKLRSMYQTYVDSLLLVEPIQKITL